MGGSGSGSYIEDSVVAEITVFLHSTFATSFHELEYTLNEGVFRIPSASGSLPESSSRRIPTSIKH